MKFVHIAVFFAFLILSGFNAHAQQQEEYDVYEHAENEADRLQKLLDLEDWQVFYVDSTLKHDFPALIAEYDKLKASKVTSSAMYQAVQIYDRFRYALDPAERAVCMKQLTDIAAENVWTISPACAPPKTIVVSNDLKNVPEKALEGYMMYTPGNTAPETFSLIRFQKGTEEDTISQILKVDKLPAQHISAPLMTRILRWSFAGIVILFLALVAMRHPFVLRRLVIMVPTLAIISVCVFSIIQLPPGVVPRRDSFFER